MVWVKAASAWTRKTWRMWQVWKLSSTKCCNVAGNTKGGEVELNISGRVSSPVKCGETLDSHIMRVVPVAVSADLSAVSFFWSFSLVGKDVSCKAELLVESWFLAHQKSTGCLKTEETARMPLCLPPDSPVWRMRLPGKGLGSQWRYSLKGKERTRVAANFSVRLKSLGFLGVASVQVVSNSSH